MAYAEALDIPDCDNSIAEILSAICVEEARELKQLMLKQRGREPMKYNSWSFLSAELETPMFGEMSVREPDGLVTYGYKASLLGQVPSAFSGPSSNDFINNRAAYANYDDSLLSIERVGVDNDGQEIDRESIGFFDTYRGRIHDAELNADGKKVVDEEMAAELRVILEYGLEKLGVKPNKIKRLAKIALDA